jgi:hypothetical protein
VVVSCPLQADVGGEDAQDPNTLSPSVAVVDEKSQDIRVDADAFIYARVLFRRMQAKNE